MSQFQITLNFNTTEISQEQAAEQLEAFQKLTEALSHDELMVTADFLAENPGAVQQIKEWVTNPPAILKMAHSMLFGK